MFIKVSLFAVLVFFLHQGDAIRCYKWEGLRSMSPVNKEDMELVDCSRDPRGLPEPYVCGKLEEEEGLGRLERGCFSESMTGGISFGCHMSGTCQFNFCSEDACNSSSALAPSAVLFLLVSAMVTAISYIPSV